MFQMQVHVIPLKDCVRLIKNFCCRPSVCLSLQAIRYSEEKVWIPQVCKEGHAGTHCCVFASACSSMEGWANRWIETHSPNEMTPVRLVLFMFCLYKHMAGVGGGQLIFVLILKSKDVSVAQGVHRKSVVWKLRVDFQTLCQQKQTYLLIVSFHQLSQVVYFSNKVLCLLIWFWSLMRALHLT